MRCKFLCVLVTLLAYQAGAQAASITIDAATNIFLASTTGKGAAWHLSQISSRASSWCSRA